MSLALLDSGTSRTRLRLWDGEQVVWQGEAAIGSAEVARTGSNAALREAVRNLLEQARQQATLEAVIASGMITSNVGLLEIPHLVAPITYAALSAHLVRHAFEDLGEIIFIPGIRTLPIREGLEGLSQADVMRGEEVEVMGLRRLLGIRGEAAFLHYGSHHKLVLTDDSGIQGSTTNLNGELLGVLAGATILKSSVAPLAELEQVDYGWWLGGLQAALEQGFSRACFMVRLADQVLKANPQQASSFLLGALASQDLTLIQQVPRLILYGRSISTEPMLRYLESQHHVGAWAATQTQSDLAAVVGTVQLFNHWLHDNRPA